MGHVNVTQALVEAAYAIGIGLVVGFEREHSGVSEGLAPEAVPEEAQPAPRKEVLLGARTFALLGLAGWLIAVLGERQPLLLPVAVVAVVAMLVVQYVLAARAGHDLGLTTEIAAVVVLLLGMVVHDDRALAVPLTMGTLLLLVAKPWTRHVVVRLRRIEITATVQLLVLVAIVLPLLPVEPADPWGAIPPQKVGLFVILIAAVEYVGYVLHRILGATRGVAVAGLVGGLTSSTAVTVAMARQARRAPATRDAAELAVLLANAVMCVRVVVVTWVLARDVAMALVAPLGLLLAALLASAGWRALALRRADGGHVEEGALALRNPFAVVPAVIWGSILCGVLLIAHFATEYLGSQGLVLAAAATGLADVDAITLAASRAFADGMSSTAAATAIAVGVASNTVVKAGLAIVGGGWRFGGRIAAVFAAGLVAGAAAAVAEWLV